MSEHDELPASETEFNPSSLISDNLNVPQTLRDEYQLRRHNAFRGIGESAVIRKPPATERERMRRVYEDKSFPLLWLPRLAVQFGRVFSEQDDVLQPFHDRIYEEMERLPPDHFPVRFTLKVDKGSSTKHAIKAGVALRNIGGVIAQNGRAEIPLVFEAPLCQEPRSQFAPKQYLMRMILATFFSTNKWARNRVIPDELDWSVATTGDLPKLPDTLSTQQLWDEVFNRVVDLSTDVVVIDRFYIGFRGPNSYLQIAPIQIH